MADGVKFASNRIAILGAEIARLKQFIDVSEKLFKDGWLGTTDGSDESGHRTAEVSGSATVGKNSGTARKNDAAKGDDDLAARELKSEDLVSASRAKKNGSEPDRKTIFRRPQE
jgi:hypothetical protein